MDREGNHIDLLISLLVRFPQIGTVHYEPNERALRLVFLLKGAHDNFPKFVQTFRDHLSLFHDLRQSDAGVTSLKRSENGVLTSVEVLRELSGLSLEELNLIVTLVSDFYGDDLIQDGPEVGEDDEIEHNSVIESFLGLVPHCSLERLTGFRDNGRVLVFSVPLIGVGKP